MMAVANDELLFFTEETFTELFRMTDVEVDKMLLDTSIDHEYLVAKEDGLRAHFRSLGGTMEVRVSPVTPSATALESWLTRKSSATSWLRP